MRILSLIVILLLPLISYSQFTEIGGSVGVNHGGAKDGGVGWVDLNEDGCLDIIFNTNADNSNDRSRILFSDCNLPNPTFTDVTDTHALGLTLAKCERSVSFADYNNDGYIDFARNAYKRFEIYLNKGPSASPPYSFGTGAQGPNLSITDIPNGMNTEGFGWMDYNGDGWLDLLIENHNFGIDIFENPADGSANFFHVTPNSDTKGLPTGGKSGDYMVLGDYNDDGFIDILARKENELDLWTNTGNGRFASNNSFNQQASNGNKGGVLLCDFDNDGDFDLFWSDKGPNEIFLQSGINSGTFVATGEPASSSGVTPSGIDGCSCADVDNDGDLDLFLGANSGSSYLYLNNGDMTFTRSNLGINVNGNAEGNSFGDYDNDGDLDLYVNRNGSRNQLWRNGLNDENYIKVEVKRDLGGGITRDDLGATAVLKDCTGRIIGGLRQVVSVKGHGSSDPAVIHFGLPRRFQNDTFLVEVRFTQVSGIRAVMDTAFMIGAVPNNLLTITTPVGFGVLDGCGVILPAELLSFDAELVGDRVQISWTTISETNMDFFSVERTQSLDDWESINRVAARGGEDDITHYTDEDGEPLSGISYYRLRETDKSGKHHFSKVVTVTVAPKASEVSVYPNPVGRGQNLTVTHELPAGVHYKLSLLTLTGRIVYEKAMVAEGGKQYLQLQTGSWDEYFYVLRITTRTETITRQIQVNPGIGMIQKRAIQYVVNVGARNSHEIELRTSLKTYGDYTDLLILDPAASDSHSLDRIMTSLQVRSASGIPLHWMRIEGSIIRIQNLNAELINVRYSLPDSDGDAGDQSLGFYPARDVLTPTAMSPKNLVIKVESGDDDLLHWQSRPNALRHQLTLGDWQSHRGELLILAPPPVPEK